MILHNRAAGLHRFGGEISADGGKVKLHCKVRCKERNQLRRDLRNDNA